MANYTYRTIGAFAEVKIPLVEVKELLHKFCDKCIAKQEFRMQVDKIRLSKDYNFCPYCSNSLKKFYQIKKKPKFRIDEDIEKELDEQMISRTLPYNENFDEYETVWLFSNIYSRYEPIEHNIERSGEFNFYEMNGELPKDHMEKFAEAFKYELDYISDKYNIEIKIKYGMTVWTEW